MAAVLIACAVMIAGVPPAARGEPNAPVGGRSFHGGAPLRPEVFLDAPLDQPSPGVVFPFGGSHHQLPGVVAVDRAPYYCVPHQRAFRERMDFVAHLRDAHGLADDEIAGAVLVAHGQVRYVGRPRR